MTTPIAADPERAANIKKAKTLISEANRSAVAAALARMSVAPDGGLLPSANKFADQGLDIARAGVASDDAAEFASYHAASVFGHCGDAWAYFGHGMNAVTRGDVEAAAHLVYYSELRAASSLLASQGIAIGNGTQYALRADGTVGHVRGEPTHKSMWNYLSEWGATAAARDTVLRIVRPGVVPLSSWLSAQFTGSTSTAVTSDLLTTVSLDFDTLSGDRSLRNHASYTPTRLRPADLTAAGASRVLSTVLDCLEPGGPRTFPLIDAVITRRLLLALHGSLTMRGSAEEDEETAAVTFTEWAEPKLPSDAVGAAVRDELILPPDTSLYDSYLDLRADPRTTRAPRERIEGMVARALVLLRLATGSASELLHEANRSPEDIDAWIEGIGLSRGMWSAGSRPDDALDLWYDLDLARDDLRGVTPADTFGLLADLGEHLAYVAQTERVLAWSL